MNRHEARPRSRSSAVGQTGHGWTAGHVPVELMIEWTSRDQTINFMKSAVWNLRFFVCGFNSPFSVIVQLKTFCREQCSNNLPSPGKRKMFKRSTLPLRQMEPLTLVLKKRPRSTSRVLSSLLKITAFDVKQLYARHFFLVTSNICPLSIPESFAHKKGKSMCIKLNFNDFNIYNRVRSTWNL